MPPERNATVIIAAVDETATLARVLAQVRRLRPLETLVVANGPDDAVAQLAAGAGARVIRHRQPVGHDVGRALGAAAARGGTLLFLDADLPIAAEELLPFLLAIDEGVDVALNRIDPYVQPAARSHPVNAAKRFLNAVLERPDLGYASLTAVPHAMSQQAVAAVGPQALAVPPLALCRAATAGLRVEAVHPVDVVGPNARRPGKNLGKDSPVERLIVGDHLEAIGWLLGQEPPSRGPFPDSGRRRDLLTL